MILVPLNPVALQAEREGRDTGIDHRRLRQLTLTIDRDLRARAAA